MNQRVNNGVTLVSRDTFVNARPVQRNLGRFDARQMANAPVERGIQVQPVEASVLGSGAPARFRPPQAIINRQVVATQRPAPPRQPFEQRQAEMNMRTEQPNAQPQPLGILRASNVRWRVRNSRESAESAARASHSDVPRPEARPQRPHCRPAGGRTMRPEGPRRRVRRKAR